MLQGESDLVDILLLLTAVAVAALVAGFAFLIAVEAWRSWSSDQRTRKHLRQ